MTYPESIAKFLGWCCHLLVFFIALICVPASQAQFTHFQKISDIKGGFEAVLDNGDDMGESVTEIGDLDLDGTPDFAMSAEGDDDGGLDKGAIYILFMNPDGTVRTFQKISQIQGGFTGNLDQYDEFGNWIAALGDVDGDGVVDLAANSFGDDDGGTDRGAIWILFMNRNGTVKGHQKISDTRGGFTGILGNGDCFGCALEGLGDFNHDGIPDLAAGTQYDDDGGYNKGAVWLLMLNADGSVKRHYKISDTTGNFIGGLDNSDQFGHAVCVIGDYDSNGVVDLAVGAQEDDDGGENAGAVWLLMLNADGTVNHDYKISDTAGGFSGGLDAGDDFGQSVGNLGDLDGDGVVDIAVGAEYDTDSGKQRGAAWILYLNRNGTVKNHFKINDQTPGFTGQLDPFDEFGQDIAAIGDLDGDGVVEMVVTADGDDDGGDHRGAAYVFFLGDETSNFPPVLESIGDRVVNEESLLEFTVTANDADGDPMVLSTSGMPQGAEFDDNGDGTGVFTYSPGVGASAGSPYMVAFIATDIYGAFDQEMIDIQVHPKGDDAFQQNSGTNGILSLEVEHYHGIVAIGIHNWVAITGAQASQNAAMQSLPDDSTNITTGYLNDSPRLEFRANFVKTGLHYLWVRGNGPSRGADSLHIGLDGDRVETAEDFKNFFPKNEYVWSNSYAKTLFIDTPGVHTIEMYMRESGFIADKLVLTTSSGYTPTGLGPDESPRGETPAVARPVITPDGGSYADKVEINIQSATLGADIYYTLDGSMPTDDSIPYLGLFWLTETATVKARAFMEGFMDSEVATAEFVIWTSSGAYLQDSGYGGIVCMEAENAHDRVRQDGHAWEDDFTDGYSGTGALIAAPDAGVNWKEDYVDHSPQLDYRVHFVKAGVHYVWIRGYAEHTGSDSIHAGLEGEAVASSANIKGFQPKREWAWAGGSAKKIYIDSVGEHRINLWMREDGFIVDKIVLTTDAGMVPSGLGPPESPIE